MFAIFIRVYFQKLVSHMWFIPSNQSIYHSGSFLSKWWSFARKSWNISIRNWKWKTFPEKISRKENIRKIFSRIYFWERLFIQTLLATVFQSLVYTVLHFWYKKAKRDFYEKENPNHRVKLSKIRDFYN